MALSDLTNPEDPYRKSLESALYNRQSDVINTQADLAQNQSRENAFGRGVGFSSILPDYSTAPIERERARALSNASQNAFLGAGQEARANAAATNQPQQFAQSQAQQAGQFQQMLRQQQRALGQQANQNLTAALGGGGLGLATLLLRPQGAGSTTLGGDIYRGIGSGIGSGVNSATNYFGDLFGSGAQGLGAGELAAQGGGFGDLAAAAPDLVGSGADLAGAGSAAIDPETADLLSQIFGGLF